MTADIIYANNANHSSLMTKAVSQAYSQKSELAHSSCSNITATMYLPAILSVSTLLAGALASAIVHGVSEDTSMVWTKPGLRFGARSAMFTPSTTTITETYTTMASVTVKVRSITPMRREAPEGWVYKGCVWDDATLPALVSTFSYELLPEDTTAEKCVAACNEREATVAALQNGNECYCGTGDVGSLKVIDDGKCNSACAGDKTVSMCGGYDSLSLFAKHGVTA